MARNAFRHLVSLVLKYPKCTLVILCITIWTLLPLRYPNWIDYKKISLSETLKDLDDCPREVSKPGEEFCVHNFKSLGDVFVHIVKTPNVSQLQALERRTRDGGAWQPAECRSPFRVAIIIPYRDRADQLSVFLQHIHPFLQRQKLDYQIFVIQQSKDHRFNRGKLFNVGYQEALKLRNFCCFILHDVDLLPESPQHIYSCSKMPRHMSSAIDIFRYVLPYPAIFGGVVAISREHFGMANGFSNKFFGWGGEDDNFSLRLRNRGLNIVRWDPSISRYTMLTHKKAQPNPHRHSLLDGAEDSEDGLSDLKFNVLDRELKPLYTWIHVDLKPSEV